MEFGMCRQAWYRVINDWKSEWVWWWTIWNGTGKWAPTLDNSELLKWLQHCVGQTEITNVKWSGNYSHHSPKVIPIKCIQPIPKLKNRTPT